LLAVATRGQSIKVGSSVIIGNIITSSYGSSSHHFINVGIKIAKL
jgi:hypothetical protein